MSEKEKKRTTERQKEKKRTRERERESEIVTFFGGGFLRLFLGNRGSKKEHGSELRVLIVVRSRSSDGCFYGYEKATRKPRQKE